MSNSVPYNAIYSRRKQTRESSEKKKHNFDIIYLRIG